MCRGRQPPFMNDLSTDDVQDALEQHEVLEVDRNRSQYRAFLEFKDVTVEDVERTLEDAFGAEAVFAVSLDDEMWGDDDIPVKVATFRLR